MAIKRLAEIVEANLIDLLELAERSPPAAMLHHLYKQGVAPSSSAQLKALLLEHGIDYAALARVYAGPLMRSVASLIEAGWTEGLITKYLGAPDATGENHRFRTSLGMRFYGAARVAEVEASPLVAEELVRMLDLRLQRPVLEPGLPKPVVRRVSAERLLAGAIEFHNETHEDIYYDGDFLYQWPEARTDSAADFLAQIQVEYAIQQLSNFNQLRDQVQRGYVAITEYELLSSVLDAVEAAYPELGDALVLKRSTINI